MRYHYKPIRLAKLKKKKKTPDNSKCWRKCVAIGTFKHCWGLVRVGNTKRYRMAQQYQSYIVIPGK